MTTCSPKPKTWHQLRFAWTFERSFCKGWRSTLLDCWIFEPIMNKITENRLTLYAHARVKTVTLLLLSGCGVWRHLSWRHVVFAFRMWSLTLFVVTDCLRTVRQFSSCHLPVSSHFSRYFATFPYPLIFQDTLQLSLILSFLRVLAAASFCMPRQLPTCMYTQSKN